METFGRPESCSGRVQGDDHDDDQSVSQRDHTPMDAFTVHLPTPVPVVGPGKFSRGLPSHSQDFPKLDNNLLQPQVFRIPELSVFPYRDKSISEIDL